MRESLTKHSRLKFQQRKDRLIWIACPFVFLILFLLVCVPIMFAAEKIRVVTSILPLAEFVEEVGKDRVTVSVMIPPGAEPHTSEPLPSQIVEVSHADVYVKVGTVLDFEVFWLERLIKLNPKMKVCDGASGIALIPMDEEMEEEHARHPQGNADPHTWVSPANAMVMVENIQKTLSQVDPQNALFYQANTQEYIQELKSLDEEIQKKLEKDKGRAFFVLHPGWGYFAERYNLRQISIEHHGKEPTAEHMVDLVKKAQEEKIDVILVAPQFNTKFAEALAREVGARVIKVDNLAKDYIANMRAVTATLSEVWQ